MKFKTKDKRQKTQDKRQKTKDTRHRTQGVGNYALEINKKNPDRYFGSGFFISVGYD